MSNFVFGLWLARFSALFCCYSVIWDYVFGRTCKVLDIVGLTHVYTIRIWCLRLTFSVHETFFHNLKRSSCRSEPGCKQELFHKCWRWVWGQSSFHDLRRLQCQAWVLEFVFHPVLMEDITNFSKTLSESGYGFWIFFSPTRQHFFQQILSKLSLEVKAICLP